MDPDTLLVRFRAGASKSEKAQARQSVGASTARSYHLVPRLRLLRLGGKSTVATAIAALSRNPNVKYASPNVAYELQSTPNDPLYGDQWGLESIGAPSAWDRTTGSTSVSVAVLDSGIDFSHPDLAGNIWTNSDEIPGNGGDDDDNGYVDDVHGWDFINNDNDPSDDLGHGSHVAGIIGAIGNNGVGVAGLNWSVEIMPLKICSAQNLCYLDQEISAIQYAVDNGVRISNASFGGTYGGYQPEEDAIRAAGAAGLLYVAAAGNNGSNNDSVPFYPASYPLDNIISVAALDSADSLASFSNYGTTSVNLAAPGQGIISTLPEGAYGYSGGYGTLSGTSMAAPFVAGAGALIRSLHPNWTMPQLRTRLLTTGEPVASLAGKVSSCGKLNVDVATDPEEADRSTICVSRSGTGSGSVSSSPGGVDCGTVCTASFAPGTQVTLTASPAAGSRFAGWVGACSGTDACTVSANSAEVVTAVFRAPGTPTGWTEAPLASPSGREPFANESSRDATFYGTSLSADARVRAKTIYNPPAGQCSFATSDTGGVFLERKMSAGWKADGIVTAPAVGTDSGARWANCSSFGSVTELSRDGSTLLVSQDMAPIFAPGLGLRYRCAAFVFRRGDRGWSQEDTLFPPGIDASGSATWDGCSYFGIDGAISDDGTRVAMKSHERVDIFVRRGPTWGLEQHLDLPTASGCAGTIAPRRVALSGDGATLMASDPDCDAGGQSAVGRVYTYTRSGSQWTHSQTIESPEPQFRNDFGKSIAISADGSTATISVTQSAPLPSGAGAAWVYEQDASDWQVRTKVSAPTPQENSAFTCPEVVADGERLVCGAYDTVGFNTQQGSLYAFQRPAAGWASASAALGRAFATNGLPSDLLGKSGSLGWAAYGVSADGSVIDAPISPTNIALGLYANDRIGYEFKLPASVPSPRISSFSPTSGPVGMSVNIMGANLTNATEVEFNGVMASYEVKSSKKIKVTVPIGANSGPISVTTPGGTATSLNSFTVTP